MSASQARVAEPVRKPGGAVRVVVVDDSAIVRKLLVDGLKNEPGIEVVLDDRVCGGTGETRSRRQTADR